MTVVLCTWGDTIEAGTEEALSAASKASTAASSELSWLVMGNIANQADELAAKYGVNNLDKITDTNLSNAGPDVLVTALSQYCKQKSPQTILFNQSNDARLVASRLAVRINAKVVMNGFDIEVENGSLKVKATAFGGDTHVIYELSAGINIVSIVTTTIVAEPAASTSSPVTTNINIDLTGIEERFKVISAPQSEGARLEDADIVVSGGRGLGKAENYELIKELAEALGGMHGASRVIVDEGWIDSSRQVGLTGKVTRPSLYLAVGISGASQHMAGCSAAKTIVAINKDPDASIYRFATYGIVADCLEVLPELIKAAKA